MKINNVFTLPDPKAATPSSAAAPTSAAFEQILTQRCQQAGAPAATTPAAQALDLASSVLNSLDKLAGLMASGATPRDLAASHEQLAGQASRLQEASASLEPGRLKGLVDETAALAYVQLWKFERGEEA